MKNILKTLFFICFIQAIFCSGEDYYTITVQEGGLSSVGCPDITSFVFYIKVITSGFVEPYTFPMFLENPSYAFASCTIPITQEGEQYITCEIDTTKFALYAGYQVTLPATLTSSTIKIENWGYVGGLSFTLSTDCVIQAAYLFEPDSQSTFNFEYYNEKGNPIVSHYGTFEELGINKNYLTESESQFYVYPYYYSDEQLKQAYCEIYSYNLNSADPVDKILCEVEGHEAIFFPTVAQESTSSTNPIFIRLNLLAKINLLGSYLKISALLLLSLLF